MVELRHLRYFLVVAEELHFGRAAKRLHLAQPGLSQQIQALERELGVELLDRSHRRVQLTAAGQVFFEEGRRALAQLERAADRAKRAGRGEVGRLVLSAAESATYAVLPRILREYGRRYPEVDLVVHEMASPAQVEALRRGDVDLAFVRTPIETKGLEAVALRDESMAVVVPEGHPLARRSTISPSDLRSERLVMHPSPASGWTELMLAVCRNAGFEPRISQVATETTVAVSFVAADLGVTLVPESLSEAARRPGVVTRPLTAPAPITRLLVIFRRDELPQTARAFLDVVRELAL
ncbi:LysR substrate-binding domain-containing protein [Pendulispora albinea]|uniref:LysR substrate-binding domain-containing protein n=1 Tax=Pendulispora albinea TaxID=2741071 RepID=A0ABZ2LWC4_9BACT